MKNNAKKKASKSSAAPSSWGRGLGGVYRDDKKGVTYHKVRASKYIPKPYIITTEYIGGKYRTRYLHADGRSFASPHTYGPWGTTRAEALEDAKRAYRQRMMRSKPNPTIAPSRKRNPVKAPKQNLSWRAALGMKPSDDDLKELIKVHTKALRDEKALLAKADGRVTKALHRSEIKDIERTLKRLRGELVARKHRRKKIAPRGKRNPKTTKPTARKTAPKKNPGRLKALNKLTRI